MIEKGYLERATGISGDCFVSPAVITVKKDKTIKIALDSRKVNEVTLNTKNTNVKHGKINFKNFKNFYQNEKTVKFCQKNQTSIMPTDIIYWTKRRNIYAYSPSRVENSLDTIVS